MKEMRISMPTFNTEKAREAIIYILHKFPDLNQGQLMDMLYFMDFDYYEKYEEHLFGFTYKKQINEKK